MKTSSAKAKGRRLQKFVAELIQSIFELDEDDVVSRPMGSPGEDIMLSPHARSKIPHSIECKSWRRYPGLNALKQARENSKGYLPSVVWKPYGKPLEDTVIFFNLKEYLEFLRSINDKKE
jgi:hypothetical protein